MTLPTPTDLSALRSAIFAHRPVARTACLVCVLCLGFIAGCEQLREAWSPRLNDTGITECGDAYANGLPCADAAAGTQAFPGQDAERGRDVDAALEADGRASFRLTKLDARGRPLPAQDRAWDESGSEAEGTRWSCVRDEVTGFVWEVKVDDATSPHHRDHSFSWYDPDPATNGGSAGTPGAGSCEGALPEVGEYTGCDTHTLMRYVNDQGGLCGYTDWRLPPREVLRSIVDYSVPESLGLASDVNLDGGFFPNALPQPLWSASSYAAAGDAEMVSAWAVDFDTGGSLPLAKGPVAASSASAGGAVFGTSSTLIGRPPPPDYGLAGVRLVRGGGAP